MRPPYLTGDTIHLRAMRGDDAERAVAWFPSRFPINAARAEEWLKETHKDSWNPNPVILAIVRNATEEIVGGMDVDSPGRRRGWVRFHLAPWLSPAEADEVRAEALRLCVPWLRDEAELMTITIPIGADEATTISAAEAVGMILGARLREHLHRPNGRADLLYYQALNPRWMVPPGDA